MSTNPSPFAVSGAGLGGDRGPLARRARRLSLLSIAWMSVEAAVAIVAALLAGSVALIGFGLDSVIELASSGVILWLYTGGRDASEVAERRAQRLIAACFAALALYLLFDAIATLAGRSHPGTSWLGMAISLAAIIVMPALARAKARVAAALGSGATAGDAAQSWLCVIAATAVLLSIAANAALRWWWLDPIAGLGIAGLAVHEGRKAWAGDVCADGAPAGLSRPGVSEGCDDDCRP
jgi:divalent metal cation (Fe/Co/Zn/Cd) transporter